MELKNLISKIESAGWKVYEYDDGIDIAQKSPAGEDFWFGANGNTTEEVIEDIGRYYESFDAEQHAAECYGMAGAPGLRALLDDADEIENMLRELVELIGE